MEQEELEADLLEVGEPSNKLDDPLEDLPAVRKSHYSILDILTMLFLGS